MSKCFKCGQLNVKLEQANKVLKAKEKSIADLKNIIDGLRAEFNSFVAQARRGKTNDSLEPKDL